MQVRCDAYEQITGNANLIIAPSWNAFTSIWHCVRQYMPNARIKMNNID